MSIQRRILLSVLLPVMIGLLFVLREAGSLPSSWPWMLAATHLFCLSVWIHFTYVFQYGYGFSMLVVPVVLTLLWRPAPLVVMVCLAMAVYGGRLLHFVYRRKATHSFASRHEEQTAVSARIPGPVKFLVGIFVSWLLFYYVLLAGLVSVRGLLGPVPWLLAALLWLAVMLEGVADEQKLAFKNQHPHTLCTTGLYRYLRHPNFAADAVFHLAALALGWWVSETWMERLAVSIAPGYMAQLMIAKCLGGDADLRKRYPDAATQAYLDRTHGLWPRLFNRGGPSG